MTKLSNKPDDRVRIIHPYIQFDSVFNDDEIAKIVQQCDELGVEKATIGEKVLYESVRVSNIKFHNRNPQNDWVFDRFNWAIEKINNDYYNFNLDGYGYFQYGKYEATNSGKYDFHMDMFMGNDVSKGNFETRKLSIVMLLNEPGVDFEGGDFQICKGQEKDAQTVEMKKGRIIAFPSFLIHRVNPVVKGTRKSIVIWVVGPKFK